MLVNTWRPWFFVIWQSALRKSSSSEVNCLAENLDSLDALCQTTRQICQINQVVRGCRRRIRPCPAHRVEHLADLPWILPGQLGVFSLREHSEKSRTKRQPYTLLVETFEDGLN